MPPKPEDWAHVLGIIWGRTEGNYPLRSKLIEEEFQVRIPPGELKIMCFAAVLSRLSIEVSHTSNQPKPASERSKPTEHTPREQARLSKEETARVRKLLNF